MKYTTILFDLDGTLTESAPGIINSIAYALKKYQIQVEDPASLQTFIGPPLFESFQKEYGFSYEQSLEAVDFFREYFLRKGIFENSVYPGIKQLLSALKQSGKKLLVATSKPEPQAKTVLEHFRLTTYFDGIYGATLDETRVSKDHVIRYAMDQQQILADGHTVMVGDRIHDIAGAKANGLISVGVLYGYGSKEELTAANADFIVDSVLELQTLLTD